MKLTNYTKLVLWTLYICFQSSYVLAQTNTKNTLEKFRKDYEKAMLSESLKDISDSYSKDIRLMPEFQKTILGKDNIRLYYAAFFNRFDVKKYSRDTIETLDFGKRVIELGYFSMNIKSATTEYELKGKYQNIWERLPNGTLTLITEAWNYNHGVDFSEQLKFDNVPSIHMALQAHLPVNSNISFELAGLNALMETTISHGDAKIWSQFFTDDGMFIYSYNPIYKGRKQLDEYLEKHVKELPIFEKLDIRNDQIDELDKYVIEYATHIANWRNGAYSGISTGKNIRIWRREPNGSLKICRQMAMYD
jgi:ketosteroid isomerase-like protein